MPKLKPGTIIPTSVEDAAINTGIAADRDTHEISATEFTKLRHVGRPLAEETKDRITIRLSREVTSYFRATGKGWQTRMDAALKEYIASHR